MTAASTQDDTRMSTVFPERIIKSGGASIIESTTEEVEVELKEDTPSIASNDRRWMVAKAVATVKKDEGNALFSSRKFPEAAAAYLQGLAALLPVVPSNKNSSNNNKSSPRMDGKEQEETLLALKDLHISLRSNLSMVYIKMEEFGSAEQQCSIVLNDLDCSNAKVWYRRGLAREGLAKAAEQALQEEGISSSTTTAKDLLKLALHDLKESIQLLDMQQQDNQMKKSVVIAMARVQRHWNRVVAAHQQSNPQQSPATAAADSPTIVSNGHCQANLIQPAVQTRPAPAEQRSDIQRLLVARNVGLQKKETTAVGEAFFLVDWKWWCHWCWYVDFFYMAEEEQQQPTKKRNGQNRQQRSLNLLPPGALLPKVPTKRAKRDGEDDSSSADSDSTRDDDDWGAGPPGPIDNSALFLPSKHFSGTTANADNVNTSTQQKFYNQWYRHIQPEANKRPLSPPPCTQQDDDDDDDQDSPTDAQNTLDGNGKGPGLLQSQPRLRPNLVRGYHYEILPREVYSAMRSWYRERTPSVCRRTTVIDSSNHEVALLPLYQLKFSEGQGPSSLARPRNGTVQTCGACRALHATSRCRQCMSVYYCDRMCQESHWQFHKAKCKAAALAAASQGKAAAAQCLPPGSGGRVGLNNVGNTCFMNSALQCLSHATPLTRHFLSNQFRLDLNTSNPLGTGGKLAHAFEAVIKEIWMKKTAPGGSFSPTALKRAIALFAPRFAGVLQHDAQEFLAYLLDGLHEDLNRVRKPPYVEIPDWNDGQDMAAASAEAWDAHRRRNNSLVMDTFYGQFKSTCVCPNPSCGRVSVSFDAFNHVSLEIPQLQKTTKFFSVLLFRKNRGSMDIEGGHKNVPSAKAMRFGITVRRGSLVADVRTTLSQLCKIPSTHLVLCETFESAICDILADNKSVVSVRSNDVITAYEVDPYTNSTIHMLANHYLADETKGAKAEDSARRNFGFPFMTSFSAHLTCRQVWDHLWGQIRHLVVPESAQNENGEDRASFDDICQQLVKGLITDNDGNPLLVFPADDGSGSQEEGGPARKTAIFPRQSDKTLYEYLGKDCTTGFMFIRLEWTESAQISRKGVAVKEDTEDSLMTVRITEESFTSFTDHPSFVEGLQKQREQNGARGVTLDQCFETFTRPERLDEHNMWYCSNCKEHVRALKTMELWRLPNVLVVHLKRFEYRHGFRRDKLGTFVDYPLEGLNMSNHCASRTTRNGTMESFAVDDGVPAVYDLFAVVNHYGRMGFGHYTAFARQWDEEDLSNDWALFDDSSVRSVGDGRGSEGADSVVSPAGYVLFYRRQMFN